MPKSSPLLSVNQNYPSSLLSPKYKYSPAVEEAVYEKAKELAEELQSLFKKEDLRTLAKAIEDEEKLRDKAKREKEEAEKEAEKKKIAAEEEKKTKAKEAKQLAKELEAKRKAAEEKAKKADIALPELKAGRKAAEEKAEEADSALQELEAEKKAAEEEVTKAASALLKLEEEKRAAEEEVTKAASALLKLEEEKRAAEKKAEEAASALLKLEEEKRAAKEEEEEEEINPLLKGSKKILANNAAGALAAKEKEKTDAEELASEKANLIAVKENEKTEVERLANEAAVEVEAKKKEKTDAGKLANKTAVSIAAKEKEKKDAGKLANKTAVSIAAKEKEKKDAKAKAEKLKREEEDAKEAEAERLKKAEEDAKEAEEERVKKAEEEEKEVERRIKKIYEDIKLSEENLKRLEKDFLLKKFARFYPTDLDKAKSVLRAELTDIKSEYYKDKPSDLAQLQLRALSYPSLTEIGNFRIPELAGVTLKITPADPSGSPSEKHVMTFTSHENAKAFLGKLSWKCIMDGEKVFSGIIPSEPTDTELTLDLGSLGENSIKTLAERIRYSHEAYKTNKASIDSRLDRTTKKLAAAALNLTFGVPLVPILCYGLGKTFKWTHKNTGFGSTLARTFLHTAKLGLENSHFLPLKNSDNETTWIGNASENLEESLKDIDYRESKIVKSTKFGIPNFVRGTSAVVTGFVGTIFNTTSIPLNFFGDFFINGAAKDLKNRAKEGGVLTKIVTYPVAAAATVIGAGFRIPGMLCRSAGSILSADANCLADADTQKTSILCTIGRSFRRIDIQTQIWSRFLAAPDDKVAEKISFEKTELSDPYLHAVRAKALDIFKNIRSPEFVSSGIPGDKREYCEVAKLTLNHNAYRLLYSPVDGAISIVSSQKDLNFDQKVNSWNTDINTKTDQNKFKELIESLDVEKNADKKESTSSKVTIARDNGGLSYEEFAVKNREFDLAKQNSKKGEINFTHADEQYEYRIVDPSATDKKVALHRKAGNNMIQVGELDEFKIINEVFANNKFKFSNFNLFDPFAKPSTSPKATIAQALAEAETKSYFSR